MDIDNVLGDSCKCPDTCCLWTGASYFNIEPEVQVVFVATNHLGDANFTYTIDNYAVGG